MPKSLVVAIFGLSALGLAVTVFYAAREAKTVREAMVLGALVDREEPELIERINVFLMSNKSPQGMPCEHRFFGRDALFAFIEYNCGEKSSLARVEIDNTGKPKTIDVLEEDPETRSRSYVTLFPPEIRARMEVAN